MAEWLELRHLRVVLAVAEEGSFTRAAHRLRIAQPSLSATVARLERRLGGPLFHRGASGARPTEAGAVLAEDARRLLAAADAALSRAQAAAIGREGTLRVGVLAYAAPALVGQAFARLAERAPRVRVEQVVATVGDRLQEVREGRLDAAFVRLPAPGPPGLAYRHLRTEPLLLAAATGTPLATAETVAVRDLDGQPLAFYPREDDPVWFDQVLGALEREGARVRVVAEGDTVFDNLPLVAAGRAITLVSASVTELVTHAGVTYRSLAPPAPTIDLGFVWHPPTAPPTLPHLLEALADAAS